MSDRSLAAILLALLLCGCAKSPSHSFVAVKDGVFTLDEKPFFPLAVNYIAHLQFNDTTCWAAPFRSYERNDRFRYNTKDSSRLLLKAEFELIRRMGFNTVRITNLASDMQLMGDSLTPYLPAQYGWGTDSIYPMDKNHQKQYLDAMEDMVVLAEKTGLKLIILIKLFPGQAAYEKQAIKLLDRLHSRPGVMAYDLFNEPLYFDIHDRPKREVYEVVKRWQNSFKAHAPNQLTTIGLVGVPEVFAWDPNVLDVDFISFHPYEYEPNQVLNELYWYGEHVDKPWMIGETSLPADNDSVSYAGQLAFARRTLAQTRACGGIGYSWWQFKDVKWGRFHSDYMGVLSQSGSTPSKPGLPRVDGTVKPVAQAFHEFNAAAPRGPCLKLPNYYNFSSFSAARLTGRILDEHGRPIEGGVVLAWNAAWTSSHYTITKSDGSFALYGDFPFHHWMASATRYSMVRGDVQPNTYFTDSSGTPTFFLGNLRLEHVSYAEPRP